MCSVLGSVMPQLLAYMTPRMWADTVIRPNRHVLAGLVDK
jgi:hypothetical protein